MNTNLNIISEAKYKGEWFEVKGKWNEKRINYNDSGLKLLIGEKIEDIPYELISATK